MKFVKTTTAFFLFLFYICHCIVGGQGQESFTNFLINAFSKFPSWAVENGKDSVFLERTINLTTEVTNVKFDAAVWNQLIHGFSAFEGSQIKGDIFEGFLDFHFAMKNFTVSGDYEINGTVFSAIPIEGNCNFRSTQNGSMSMSWTRFSNLRVINDYIDMSEAQRSISNVLIMSTSLEFGGLWAGGHEKRISEMLHNTYTDRYRNSWMKHVLLDLLQEYFTELFEKTPVSEIIGTKVEPPKIN